MIHFKENKNKSALSTRWAQMSKQEQIIEKKKMEIQAKIESQKQAAALAAQAKLSNPSVPDETGSPNIFSNDGSFMSQYKALLEKQTKDKVDTEAKDKKGNEGKEDKKKSSKKEETSENKSNDVDNQEMETHNHNLNQRKTDRNQRDRHRRWNDRGRNRPHSPMTPVIEDRKKVIDTSNIPSLMQLTVRPPDENSLSPDQYNNPWNSQDGHSNDEYELDNQQENSLDNSCPDSGPMGPGPMGVGPMGPGPMGSRPMAFGPMGPGLMGPGQMMPNAMGPGPMGPGPMGPGPMGAGPMGPGSMGPGPMGPGPMGSGPLGPGPMGPRPMGPGQMGQNMSSGPNGPGPLMRPGGPNMPPMPPFMGGPPNFPMPPNFMRPNGPNGGPGPMPPNMCGPNMRGPGPNGPMPFFPPFNNSPMGPKGPPNSMMPPNSMRMPFGPNGPPNFGPQPPFGNDSNFGPNNGPPMGPPNMHYRPPNSLSESLDNISNPDSMKLPPMPFNQVLNPKDMESRNTSSPHPNQVLSADAIPPAVKRAATEVATNGDHWENVLKAIQDQKMWFLHNTNSNEYKAYRDLVGKLRKEGVKPEIKPEDKYEPEFSLEDDDDSNDSKPIKQMGSDSFDHYSNQYPNNLKREKTSSQSDEESDSKKERRKRKKSRWGNDPPVDIKPPGIVAPLPNTMPPLPPTVPGGNLPKIEEEALKMTGANRPLMQYAVTNYGTTNLSPEDWKKCEDNFKLNLLYQDMLKKRQEVERLEAAGKHRYEYDSDEDTADGTWEHKLRAKEMNATERWATELTKQAEGKHHIGDFLPPEELKKFMEKYSAVKSGKEPDLSDYKEYKLKEDNVGFKMLQKLGWNEGQGLGAEGTGIVEPINKANQPVANLGLGASNSDMVSCEDDEFDAYRKRMMLAYRFRPNPLNNPRRPYY